MKAIQISQPPQYGLADVPDPQCGREQVIVRTAFCGVCGTDLEILRGGLAPGFTRYPLVPGHEWTGVVEEVGAEVKDRRVGDRVSVEGYLPCGHCAPCLRGEINLCLAHEQIGLTHNGGFAEFVAAPARSCHLVPEHIGLDEALMVEPASTVVRGIARARLQPGAKVAIVGCGPIGLVAARVARLHDPGCILGIDLAPTQESMALRAGVNQFTTSTDARQLRERSGGEGWDAVVNCAQGARAMELGCAIARRGGTVVMIGGAPEEEQFRFPAHALVMRDLRIEGIVGYTSPYWIQTLDLLIGGKLKLGDLITHRTRLDQFDDALRLIQSRSEPTGKVAVTFA